jgi:peptidoglycan/xylan/chitin deacetylase (PgdA/CDA1 family)
MRIDREVGVAGWVRRALLLSAFACIGTAASAADCPGHPDALGTSRVLVVDPHEHPHIGAMQYKETLPLHDHEVVLTFDDGPVPKYSNQILKILADQCVKATFFTIGVQAQASPAGVRKLAAEGQTIGTHSQHHPLTFNKMTLEQAKPEVDQGIASVSAALTDPSALSPFFRVPGLLRAPAVEGYTESLGLQMWSADFLADDWREISATRVYELAIKRLEARGKGILLLHDIHARTVAALPRILTELKARGYHIVQVVPASAERPATPTEPREWLVHPHANDVPVADWPAIPTFDFAGSTTLRGITTADFGLIDSARQMATGRLREAAWPGVSNLPQPTIAPALPVPAANLFEMPSAMQTAIQPVRHAARSEATQRKPGAVSSVASPGVTSKLALRRATNVTERRPIRVASLKKR